MNNPTFIQRKAVLLLLVLATFFLTASPALAHKPSDSYLMIRQGLNGDLTGEWHLSLRDLDYALGLDENDDGNITWKELRAKEPALEAYACSRLHVSSGLVQGQVRVTELLVDNHSDGAYAVLRFQVKGLPHPTAVDIEYQALFDVDPTHRGLLRLKEASKSMTRSAAQHPNPEGDQESELLDNASADSFENQTGAVRLAIFSPTSTKLHFELQGRGSRLQLVEFIKEGVWHIWTGYDHLLFLIALLLPAVLKRGTKEWLPQSTVGPVIHSVLKTVTAFTVAHSITLSLAVLQIVNLPPRLVESTIAASVVLAALNNLYPLFSERTWVVAFLFGLVHGFGFASALADLGLQSGTFAVGLFGFNFGVELGQLTVVALFLLPALFLRDCAFYRYRLMPVGSALITVMAGTWFVERACDLKLLPY